jgi:hypothetical protein
MQLKIKILLVIFCITFLGLFSILSFKKPAYSFFCGEDHYKKECYDNDVYWYDCCGVRNDKYQECGDSEWQNEYKCSGNWVQRKYIERGCSNAQCYEKEVWKEFQYCSNYCSDGKCILPPKVITKGVVLTY